MRRAWPLHSRILVGMIAGALLGLVADALWGGAPWLAGFITWVTEPVGRIFLRLIFMVVIPLVVSALVLGVAEIGDVRRLGRVGLRTLLYTVVLSAVSVLLGVGLANLIRPGEGMSP
ncbi:MAG TPA: cation:dicarboxylase symporter family transporter, partial [Candidatus Polarisedimenticolia bacterium]|nr:cation:dicarboxylase symporter family transporter [Candidatus Polarisedimenticolia bacterium]